MDHEFARRYVNDGFSGGEMKRAEILQMAMLQPKFAILDETDSGLDADAVRLASQSIAEIGRDKMGLLSLLTTTNYSSITRRNTPTSFSVGGSLNREGWSSRMSFTQRVMNEFANSIPTLTRSTSQWKKRMQAKCWAPDAPRLRWVSSNF